MPRCTVVGCSVVSGNKDGYKLFSFPKDQEDARHWVKNINRAGWEPKKNSRICSKHFIDGQPSDENPFPELEMGHQVKKVKRRRTATSKAAAAEKLLTLTSPSRKARRILKKLLDTSVGETSASTATAQLSMAPLSDITLTSPTKSPSCYPQTAGHVYYQLDGIRAKAKTPSSEKLPFYDPTNPPTPYKEKERRFNKTLIKRELFKQQQIFYSNNKCQCRRNDVK